MNLPPATYTVESVYSMILGQYVGLIKMSEEDTHAYVETFPLDRMTTRNYIEVVVMTHIENPEVVKNISATLYMEFLAEMYQYLILLNPCLQIGHIIKERKVGKKTETTASKSQDLAPAEIYDVIREHLYSSVIGQRDAIDEVVKAVGRGLLRKDTNKKRPIVSMLFAGISGTGKTHVAHELAAALSKAGLVNEKDALVQINAGEYGDSHQLNRLTGAPLGYIGSDQDTLLEKRIKPKNVQVLLVDEVEKAHFKMYNFLLGILEEGTVSTGKNANIDMTNTIVILTSNLGSKELAANLSGGLGFKKEITYDKNAVVSNVKKSLPIEFFNRLNHIIIFSELSREEAKQVAKLELDQLRVRMDHLVSLEWSDEVEDALVDDLPRETGLRPIRSRVENVEGDISTLILNKKINKGCPVTLSVEDKRVVVKEQNVEND